MDVAAQCDRRLIVVTRHHRRFIVCGPVLFYRPAWVDRIVQTRPQVWFARQ